MIITWKMYIQQKWMVVAVQSVQGPFWIHNRGVLSRHLSIFPQNHAEKWGRILPKKRDLACALCRYPFHLFIVCDCCHIPDFVLILLFKVWFQNQRAKVKKIQKKSKVDTKSNSETESLGESSLENETKIKMDNESMYTLTTNHTIFTVDYTRNSFVIQVTQNPSQMHSQNMNKNSPRKSNQIVTMTASGRHSICAQICKA